MMHLIHVSESSGSSRMNMLKWTIHQRSNCLIFGKHRRSKLFQICWDTYHNWPDGGGRNIFELASADNTTKPLQPKGWYICWPLQTMVFWKLIRAVRPLFRLYEDEEHVEFDEIYVSLVVLIQLRSKTVKRLCNGLWQTIIYAKYLIKRPYWLHPPTFRVSILIICAVLFNFSFIIHQKFTTRNLTGLQDKMELNWERDISRFKEGISINFRDFNIIDSLCTTTYVTCLSTSSTMDLLSFSAQRRCRGEDERNSNTLNCAGRRRWSFSPSTSFTIRLFSRKIIFIGFPLPHVFQSV